MFRSVVSPKRVPRPYDYRDGWNLLGLGDPSTLWYADDQLSIGAFFTRYGFAWSVDQQDGGTLSIDTATWGGGKKLIQLNGSGAAVRVGLRCDAMAEGGSAINAIQWTLACPVYFPPAFPASGAFAFAFNGPLDSSRNGTFWNAITPGFGVSNNGVNIIVTALWAPVNGIIDPKLQRKMACVFTARVNGANVDFKAAFRTSAGTYTTNVKSTGSVAASVWSKLGQGYNPVTTGAAGAASSAQAFGGAVGWRGVGATDAQMTAILDKWQSLYPL